MGRRLGKKLELQREERKGLQREEPRESSVILDNLEENIPRDRIVEKLIRRFSMTPEEAECCCQRIAGQSF